MTETWGWHIHYIVLLSSWSQLWREGRNAKWWIIAGSAIAAQLDDLKTNLPFSNRRWWWGFRYWISILFYYILQASATRQVNHDIHIILSNIHHHDHHDQGSPKLILKDKHLSPWDLNADALIFTDKHLCSLNWNYGIQVRMNRVQLVCVKPLKHLATLWNCVTHYSHFLTVKAASQALSYASIYIHGVDSFSYIWYTTKGEQKISPWYSKLLQMGQNFSRLHEIKYFLFGGSSNQKVLNS